MAGWGWRGDRSRWQVTVAGRIDGLRWRGIRTRRKFEEVDQIGSKFYGLKILNGRWLWKVECMDWGDLSAGYDDGLRQKLVSTVRDISSCIQLVTMNHQKMELSWGYVSNCNIFSMDWFFSSRRLLVAMRLQDTAAGCGECLWHVDGSRRQLVECVRGESEGRRIFK